MAKHKFAISSGHGLKVRGASGIIDEVDEARRVVDCVVDKLKERGVTVTKFHDNTSTSQNENLETIVNFHNDQDRDLDISVHFNAYEQVEKPMGTEVLYVTQESIAARLSAIISEAGDFIDRGPKYRSDLYFLNQTDGPAVLLEICFVDSETDCELYDDRFEQICEAIAEALSGVTDDEIDEPDEKYLFRAKGTCSYFGGPGDTGVTSSEDLAFFETEADITKAPQLFLPYQPFETTGLARRLNPHVHYVACRWDYDDTPKDMLVGSGKVALVRSVRNPDKALTAFPADWGPNENTGRVADLSPGLMVDLGLETDDEVEVIYPYEGS